MVSLTLSLHGIIDITFGISLHIVLHYICGIIPALHKGIAYTLFMVIYAFLHI